MKLMYEALKMTIFLTLVNKAHCRLNLIVFSPLNIFVHVLSFGVVIGMCPFICFVLFVFFVVAVCDVSSLWRAPGQQIGREARVLVNYGNAYSTYWTPEINLVRAAAIAVALVIRHTVTFTLSLATHTHIHTRIRTHTHTQIHTNTRAQLSFVHLRLN